MIGTCWRRPRIIQAIEGVINMEQSIEKQKQIEEIIIEDVVVEEVTTKPVEQKTVKTKEYHPPKNDSKKTRSRKRF